MERGCEVKNLDYPSRRQGRDTGVVRTYGQYCPIARGAEIFAERWTPLIIRNLYLGCGSFSEILEGAPGLSRTLLSQRLKHLERLGIVESAAKLDGRGRHYELTRAGHDLFTVCRSLGEWGAHWLEIAPEHLDPFVALWSMCNMLRRDRLPERRVVIRFDFTGRQRAERYWLLIEHGEPEICKTCPGLDEDLYITAEAEAFVKWHAGQQTWAEATRDGRIQLHGPSWLVRAFPTWNARSAFAHIKPVSQTARRASRHRRPSRSKGRRRLWGSRPGERPMSGPAPPSGWSHSLSATSRSGDQACLLHRPLCCETVRRPIRRNRRWRVTACIFVITLWHGMIRAPRGADNLCGSRRARMLSATSCIPRCCSAKRSITSARALGREKNGE